jgi:hypothetical protein
MTSSLESPREPQQFFDAAPGFFLLLRATSPAALGGDDDL